MAFYFGKIILEENSNYHHHHHNHCFKLLNRDDYLLILDSWREEWEKGVQVPVNPDTLPHSVVTHDDLLSSSSKEFNLPKEWITVRFFDFIRNALIIF